jgi:hypothetical protein
VASFALVESKFRAGSDFNLALFASNHVVRNSAQNVIIMKLLLVDFMIKLTLVLMQFSTGLAF